MTPGDSASRYIQDNFQPTDRLAVVLLNKRTDSVIQRLAVAENIIEHDFQAWLYRHNGQHYDVYISMNALTPNAMGRTKADVEAIRHIYLDFDENGTHAVNALLKREDLPKPNYLVSTSPDKWQVIWKVEGFGKNQAEELQRNLVRELDADPAATDCTRVLRIPGFYNCKYAEPYLVRAEEFTSERYRPDRFPDLPIEERSARWQAAQKGLPPVRILGSRKITQSERDWAYAKRALARGESPNLVAAAIAIYRRYDKHDPQSYAERTVKKAAESLRDHFPRASSLTTERT